MSEIGSIKVWVLVFIVLFAVGTVALVGIGCAVGANQCPFVKHKAQTSLDGKVLYETNCILCHGVSGEGRCCDAPPLRSGDAATLTLAQIEAKVANGKPFFMPAYSKKKPGGTFTDAQIEAVARYVISLRKAS
jgi:mono/diheme cytochrome c family protein